ncbi:alpha/beta fold hydrolase [Roseomonas populi]|uniref:Alpha/beta hydrolase n=1 Tax=Roseomonas populi TaxID=3121582 RepID=A0ABT1XDH7_9PROT|nr:alpha/beta hydrolase [Roseomonas pecuniae]MCR0985024.1 alpha/beta hydrolase [Roseomonas pecuniae]
MQSVTVEGSRVAYEEAGTGDRCIVFVHGGFGSSSGLWWQTMAALPAGWRGLAINNFIESDPPPAGYNIPSFARRLAGFIRALTPGRAVICGHSMGGVVCQEAAISHPEVVAGLVLVGTGPSIRNHGIAMEVLRQLEEGGGSRENLEAISRHWFAEIPDQTLFDEYVDTATRAPLQGMIDAQLSLVATDQEPRLPRIGAPTLILHGARDHGRTMEHAHRLRDGIPDTELVVFPESGHAPMWEAAAAFDTALARFLTRLPDSRFQPEVPA